MAQQPLGPFSGVFTDGQGRLTRDAQVWLSLLLRKVNFRDAYADFYFETVSAGQQSAVFVNDTGYNLAPALLNLTAVEASATGATLFDVQTSADLIVWTSILSGGGLTLPKAAQSIPAVTQFVKGAVLAPGSYCWAVTKTGTATDAKQALVQLEFEYSLRQQ